jgi:hypothetical protein
MLTQTHSEAYDLFWLKRTVRHWELCLLEYVVSHLERCWLKRALSHRERSCLDDAIRASAGLQPRVAQPVVTDLQLVGDDALPLPFFLLPSLVSCDLDLRRNDLYRLIRTVEDGIGDNRLIAHCRTSPIDVSICFPSHFVQLGAFIRTC